MLSRRAHCRLLLLRGGRLFPPQEDPRGKASNPGLTMVLSRRKARDLRNQQARLRREAKRAKEEAPGTDI